MSEDRLLFLWSSWVLQGPGAMGVYIFNKVIDSNLSRCIPPLARWLCPTEGDGFCEGRQHDAYRQTSAW